MNLDQLAALIPAEYRREILNLNMISQAIASGGDNKMVYLITIWKNYVEPDIEIGCGMCLERVLKHYRDIQPNLIKLEKQSRLLDHV